MNLDGLEYLGELTDGGYVWEKIYYDSNKKEFVKIVSILSNYCTFPVKLDYVPSKPENEEKKVIENKNGEWFKPAGDL